MRFVAAFLTTFLLLLVSQITTAQDSKEPPTDLVIDVLHKPEPCTETTAAGDRIAVHYVCSEFSN